MSNVSVYNMEGNEVGTLELNDAVFGVEVNEHLVHMAVPNTIVMQVPTVLVPIRAVYSKVKRWLDTWVTKKLQYRIWKLSE